MKDASRYANAKVKQDLLDRSNGFCECCGADLPTDKHHILEFSKGGPTETANLIVVCQSCHKQLPLYLDREQQFALQRWHLNQTTPNKSASHTVSSVLNSFVLGSNTYINCGSVLRIADQNILTPIEVNGRFYVNVVMLSKEFGDRMLILSNRVIKNGAASIETADDGLTVRVSGREIFSIYRRNNSVHIDMDITYKGQVFRASKTAATYPGLNMTDCTFSNCVSAVVYNS